MNHRTLPVSLTTSPEPSHVAVPASLWFQLDFTYLQAPPTDRLQVLYRLLTAESNRKVGMDVRLELRTGFQRCADEAGAEAEGRREPDGLFSVNRRGDLECSLHCPHRLICLCHCETQMRERARVHFGGKRDHAMISPICRCPDFHLPVDTGSFIYMLNILDLIKVPREALFRL